MVADGAEGSGLDAEGRGGAVRAAVEEFCASRPRLSDPKWSFDRCLATSRALRTRLVRMGFEAGIVRLSRGLAEWSEADPRWGRLVSRHAPSRSHHWMHYAVLSEGLVIDAAFRQFDPAAAHPRVLGLDEVRVEWGSIATRPFDDADWTKIPAPAVDAVPSRM